MPRSFLKNDLEQVVSGKNCTGKNGTGNNGTGNNGTNGKLSKIGTFSILAL